MSAAGRLRRPALLVLAVVCAGLALTMLAAPRPAPAQAGAPGGDAARGHALFAAGCASCHGDRGEGRSGQGPSLRGAGAASADFYLRTGRMPLSDPRQEPARAEPVYGERDIRDLVAYVASLGPGPPIPRVQTARADLSRGRELFTSQCAGCHQVAGRGGIMPGAIAPPLQQATATQIAEAVRVGPYTMPVFSEAELPQRDLDAVTRYVLWTRTPDDRGGWSIGNLGPIPEGMVAWFLAGVALLVVARLLGERTP